MKKTHILDGIAFNKILIWLKNNYKKKITEIYAQEKTF